MSSNATTRRTRTAAGKCTVCLRRAATAGNPTCRSCRSAIASYGAKRYADRVAAGECVRCGAAATGYLCEPHAEERRQRRRA